MIIQMIEIKKGYVPSKEGVYLIRTESNLLKTVHYMDAFITIKDDTFSIGVKNQTVTHISVIPVL